MKISIREALFESEVVGLEIETESGVWYIPDDGIVHTGRVVFPDEGRRDPETKERIPTEGKRREIAVYENGKLSKKRVR